MRLHVEAYGQGPPLVILHGLLGSASNWRSIARRLGQHFQVFLPDLRNHGQSPHHPDMSYRAMAADVAELIQPLNQPPVVIGHSMGGKTAMVLALEGWQDLAGLVVVDIAPVSYPIWHRDMLEAMLALDLVTLGQRRQVDAALATTIADTAVRQFLLTNLVSCGEGLCWRSNLGILLEALPEISGFPTFPPAQQSQVRSLFIAGARSNYVRDDHQARIQQLFPRHRLHRIAAAGHWLHAEKPAEFLRELLDFMPATS